MNKYQEALDKLDYCANQSSCWYCKFGVGCEGIQKIVSPLKELVDKATPKKPIKSNNPLFDYMVFCPACNKSISFKNYYCGSCGQALDWSDKDDK